MPTDRLQKRIEQSGLIAEINYQEIIRDRVGEHEAIDQAFFDELKRRKIIPKGNTFDAYNRVVMLGNGVSRPLDSYLPSELKDKIAQALVKKR